MLTGCSRAVENIWDRQRLGLIILAEGRCGTLPLQSAVSLPVPFPLPIGEGDGPHRRERLSVEIQPGIILHKGDCMSPEGLRSLPDGSVDAVITDPPYNEVNQESGGLRELDKGVADSAPISIPALAAEFVRISKGSIYVWCGFEQVSEWVAEFRRHGLTVRVGAWVKSNPSPMNGESLWLSAIELCVFARKAKAPFFRHCAKPVWTGPIEQRDDFATPKPVWLMREQITASVPPDGVVCDPFMGSGSTGEAAYIDGRRFVGWEKEPAHFEVAKSRFRQARFAFA